MMSVNITNSFYVKNLKINLKEGIITLFKT